MKNVQKFCGGHQCHKKRGLTNSFEPSTLYFAAFVLFLRIAAFIFFHECVHMGLVLFGSTAIYSVGSSVELFLEVHSTGWFEGLTALNHILVLNTSGCWFIADHIILYTHPSENHPVRTQMTVNIFLLEVMIVHRDCQLRSYTLAHSVIIMSRCLAALLNHVWVFFNIIVLIVKDINAGSDRRWATDLTYRNRYWRKFNVDRVRRWV